MSGSERTGVAISLAPDQRTQLEALATGADAVLGRRAQIILLAAQGLPAKAIAPQVSLSVSRVYHWLRRFHRQGMDIFVREASRAASTPRRDGKQPITLAALCKRYSVDLAHARHVAALAAQLFVAAAAVHGLSDDDRRLLDAAAYAHNVAFELDPSQHHLRGRDILLEQPLVGFSEAEQQMLACLAAFHREKVRPDAEPAFIALKKRHRRRVLALTALLRLADGLDYSRTQTTTIGDIHLTHDALILTVEGEDADFNARRAQRKADWWTEHFGMPVLVQTARMAEAHVAVDWAVLDPSLNLVETGRQLLGHYLAQLEQDADRFREGEQDDLAPLERDMSRLAGVLELTGSYFDVTAVAGFKKDIRWLRRFLSETVVLELLLARAQETLAELDSEANAEPVPEPGTAPGSEPGTAPGTAPGRDAAADLRQALEGWEADAKKARRKLGKALDGKRYRAFVSDLLAFTGVPGEGVFPGANRNGSIRTQAGLLIWRELADLRAVMETGEDVAAQWLRARRLHNRLQFFRNLLGGEVVEVLARLQPFEAQLRAVVLGTEVLHLGRQMLTREGKVAKKRPRKRPGVQALVEFQESWLAHARDDLSARWESVDSVDFRQQLGLAIAAP